MEVILNWLRRLSLYKVKLAVIGLLTAAFVLNITLEINLRTWEFRFSDGDISLWTIIALFGICLLIIWVDFRLELILSRERKNKNLLEALKSSEISDRDKKEIIEMLKDNP